MSVSAPSPARAREPLGRPATRAPAGTRPPPRGAVGPERWSRVEAGRPFRVISQVIQSILRYLRLSDWLDLPSSPGGLSGPIA